MMADNKGTFVSVVVASYNYANYIVETLDSLLAQTYGNFEVVVVDDGSTDNSVEVIQGYVARDQRIRLVMHEGGKNRGLLETLRLGIGEARGEFVAFCESDDLWTPDHLEMKMEMLRRYPDAVIMSNDVRLIDHEEGAWWMGKYFKRLRRTLHEGENVINIRHHLSRNHVPTFSCVMIRTDVLRSLNFDTIVPKWLDIWLYHQILCRYPLHYVDRQLTLWRIHDGSQNSEHLHPLVKQYYAELRRLLNSITGGPWGDLYMQRHPWRRLLCRCTGWS